MEPKLSFTIPSLHDDNTLDCRLYYPAAQAESNGRYKARGAIIAHPYAPLGGCYDDPVVGLIVSELSKQAYEFVCTFNFRGAYGSAGHTSWTGKAERSDYESAVGFMIEYLQHYEVPTAGESNVFSEGAHVPVQLVLGGYSYGSWICSHLPEALEIWKQFIDPLEGTSAAEIKARALHLASQTNQEMRSAWQETRARQRHTLTIGGDEISPDKRHRSGDDSGNSFGADIRKSLDFAKRLGSVRRKHYEVSNPATEEAQASDHANRGPNDSPDVEVAYLLVSPLLPPISAFTTLPFGINALKAHTDAGLEKFSVNSSLAVFGSDDMFTSAKKLRSWAQDISSKPSSRFHFVEVDDAGHFWRSYSAQKSLRIAIREWIQGISAGTPTTADTKFASEVADDSATLPNRGIHV